MRKIHQYWKIIVIGFVLLCHIAVGMLARIFLSGQRKRAFNISQLQRNSRVVLAILGIEVVVENPENWREGRNYLVVSNHMSYLDTLIIASFRPVCFVSTIEVLETPFLGQITEAAGSLFVERRSRENILMEISEISGTLQQGFNLMFFPEGTSTNGEKVLPFKRPLFAPAERTRTPVLPLVIEFKELDREKVTRSNRDLLCWYGDMDFGPHLLALAGYQGASVKLKVLPEVPVNEKTSREELASKSQIAISENYQPIS